MNPNRIKELALELTKAAEGRNVQIETGYGNVPTVTFFDDTYEKATDTLREFGAGIRHKHPDDTGTFTRIEAHSDGVNLIAFAYTLPPTCRVEIVKRKIPKTQTVDTGEFIEIEERKLVCDEAKQAPQIEAEAVA